CRHTCLPHRGWHRCRGMSLDGLQPVPPCAEPPVASCAKPAVGYSPMRSMEEVPRSEGRPLAPKPAVGAPLPFTGEGDHASAWWRGVPDAPAQAAAPSVALARATFPRRREKDPTAA